MHFYKDDYQFISIHALREEGDILQTRKILARDDFYPRPPRGGRPILRSAVLAAKGISIHALREEGDVMQSFTKKYCFQFLSTPSARRATFKPEQSSVLQGLFLSTPSARRATGGSYLFLG